MSNLKKSVYLPTYFSPQVFFYYRKISKFGSGLSRRHRIFRFDHVNNLFESAYTIRENKTRVCLNKLPAHSAHNLCISPQLWTLIDYYQNFVCTFAACRVHLYIKQLINPAPAFLTSYSISSGQSLINSVYTFVDPNVTLALAAPVNCAAKLIINGGHEQHYVWLTKSGRNVIRLDFLYIHPAASKKVI